jgi:hypothetical protein
LQGCKNVIKHNSVKDKFYTDRGSWDAARIPLIKPYELLRLNGSEEWTMNLEAPGSVSNIKEINVSGNVIVIHAGQTYCNNIEVSEAWFIIIPNKHIEKGFDNIQDFDKHLASLGNKDRKLHDVKKVYEVFNSKGKVDWDVDF